MPGKARVLAIALDAADPTLVREFATAGEMPNVARLLDEAAVVDTLAPPGVFVSANWPSIFTADLPDRTTYLCWEEIAGGTYEHRVTSPRMVRGTPIWQRMSEAGRRVAVLDVPHSIVEPLNGVMLAEWGCHDRHFGTESWPAELAGELTENHGEHYGSMDPPAEDQFAPCDWTHRAGSHRTDEETVSMFDAICRGLETKRSASLELLDRGDWDFFLTVLCESHCTGHQVWHLHDPSHPGFDQALANRLGGDPMREIYRRLDAVLGEHLSRLSPQDTAYVLMAHGMTAHYDGTHLLDQVLHRLDLGLDDPRAFGIGTRAASELAHLIPPPLRRRALRSLAPLLRRQGGHVDSGPPPPLAERRWFQTPNNTVVGAVRLNLAGREPNGRIDPEDRRETLDWLSVRLRELVNVETGGPVVRRCEITDDIYRRSPDDAFGDLYIEWERSAPIERVWSPATGTVAAPFEHWRQGDHVREGLVLAAGPGIRSGQRRRVSDTVDVGATLAAAVGVQLPDADGRPIKSVLPPGAAKRSQARRAITRGRASLGKAVRRRAERQVPDWAGRQDPAFERLRSDFTAHAEKGAEEADTLKQRIDRLERQADIAAMAAWLPQAEVAEELLVSVVMPTRNRCSLLRQAIASVQAQSYPHWELLVVDDGSTDDTAECLEQFDDPRIRILSSPGSGVCAARNLGLDAARGDLIAYLDDDNLFDPQWLKAIVLTFNSFPQQSVCYGAMVFDDGGRVHFNDTNGRAGFHFVAWDREKIREDNFVDMNVLAHRRSPIRFDEEIAHFGDWDLLLRLTPDADPVEVPAIAAYYRTDVEGRMSTAMTPEEIEREYEHVRAKLAANGG